MRDEQESVVEEPKVVDETRLGAAPYVHPLLSRGCPDFCGQTEGTTRMALRVILHVAPRRTVNTSSLIRVLFCAWAVSEARAYFEICSLADVSGGQVCKGSG